MLPIWSIPGLHGGAPFFGLGLLDGCSDSECTWVPSDGVPWMVALNQSVPGPHWVSPIQRNPGPSQMEYLRRLLLFKAITGPNASMVSQAGSWIRCVPRPYWVALIWSNPRLILIPIGSDPGSNAVLRIWCNPGSKGLLGFQTILCLIGRYDWEQPWVQKGRHFYDGVAPMVALLWIDPTTHWVALIWSDPGSNGVSPIWSIPAANGLMVQVVVRDGLKRKIIGAGQNNIPSRPPNKWNRQSKTKDIACGGGELTKKHDNPAPLERVINNSKDTDLRPHTRVSRAIRVRVVGDSGSQPSACTLTTFARIVTCSLLTPDSGSCCQQSQGRAGVRQSGSPGFIGGRLGNAECWF
ncbi:hypothetical protein BDK51DRAFT_26988 [Blyttiomyces helicus]|uniref:Uncharacterized protein n=1 Tax=Blyttiomyces helicus TaxID=388810 RepID=A0A4P9W6U8_9FUNG|nr:hypothetical protein BDK51DRAFT_26988 [Blyttiomyces helicus]|eukprot:RKO87105.1 hypothetical protein BDK51DRAFT_26988 [Blyttiomyces helicus]